MCVSGQCGGLGGPRRWSVSLRVSFSPCALMGGRAGGGSRTEPECTSEDRSCATRSAALTFGSESIALSISANFRLRRAGREGARNTLRNRISRRWGTGQPKAVCRSTCRIRKKKTVACASQLLSGAAGRSSSLLCVAARKSPYVRWGLQRKPVPTFHSNRRSGISVGSYAVYTKRRCRSLGAHLPTAAAPTGAA